MIQLIHKEYKGGKNLLPIKVHYKEESGKQKIINAIKREFKQHGHREVVIVCVGTDRSTGDALGPLTGSTLVKKVNKNVTVYGTIDSAVHGQNLHEIDETVKRKHPNAFVIAIDACLGHSTSVESITFAKEPLRPGAGVGRDDLPRIGHCHIAGIVNVGGFMEYFVLQNTRLSIVMNMSDAIADIIIKSFKNQKLVPSYMELVREA
ncbi:hypothetical protein D3C81_519940 [compost metagenome]